MLSRLVNAEVSYFSLNIVERYTLSRKVRKEVSKGVGSMGVALGGGANGVWIYGMRNAR